MKTPRRDFLKLAGSVLAGSAASPLICRGAWANVTPRPHGPSVHFPAAPRERIAVASYPFRDHIAGRRDAHATAGKMPLKEFAAHVREKFNVSRIEPWSEHFLSTDAEYLDELREAVARAGSGFANIAADGRDSFYSTDATVRDHAMEFAKKWIDVAARISSHSLRINIPEDKTAKPDAALVAESAKKIAVYAESKNVVVHHENDNAVSENPFFIADVLDRVKSPWVRALPDFGNSVAALPAEEAYRGVEEMFARAYGISHAKDPMTNEKGTAVPVDMARVFAVAKKHNYRGYFSMEWDTEGDPYAGTAKLIEATLKNLA